MGELQMVIDYILFLTIACSLAIIANFLRFKGRDTVNKWVLILSSLVFIEIYGFLSDFTYFSLSLLLVISISVISFGLIGGITSSLLAFLQIVVLQDENAILIVSGYIVFVVGLFFATRYMRAVTLESHDRLSILLNNSKQLNLFREVSLTMQQTLNLEKLLQTILTTVTAGYGLGFNRAIIMLTDKSGTRLKGKMGTGPMTVEEGLKTWEEISRKKYDLNDLIQIKGKVETTDQKLNDRVKTLEISLEQESFLSRTLESGIPCLLDGLDQTDEILKGFVAEFNIAELAVFPLVSQGNKVGVLLVDNPVNKKPITAAEIDSVIPLANQAAIAIYQTHLYNQIENMALRDGLTNLLNQRAFQNQLEEFSLVGDGTILSLIMIDIDSFKHFNDTNGHLIGNQVLVKLSEVIQNTLEDGQLAFRFGGEEFSVLLSGADTKRAVEVAESIRENVANTPFPYEEKQPFGNLTISVGVATKKVTDSMQIQELIDSADKALYEAKRSGKNRVVAGKGVLHDE
jgi:diguanylate cyclase (GGDEF)-like protein